MITIMGATGQVGGRITGLLLDAGDQVSALGRSAEKLASAVEVDPVNAYYVCRP